MRYVRLIVGCVGIVSTLALCPGAAIDPDPTPIDNVFICPFGRMVVQARVIAVVKHGAASSAMLEITHVYAGDEWQPDVAFLITTMEEGSGSDGRWHIPALKVGENVVWVVRHPERRDRGDDPTLLVAEDWAPIVKLPGRDGTPTGRYEGVRQWAEQVETIWHMPVTARLPVLLQLMGSKNPEIACWSIRAVARCGFRDAEAALRALVRERGVRPEPAAIADEELARIAGDRWRPSDERRDLFLRLVSDGPINDHELMYLRNSVESAIQDRGLHAGGISKIVRAAIANPSWGEDAQAQMLRLLADTYRIAKGVDRVVIAKALGQQMAVAPRRQIRRAAAEMLLAPPLDSVRAQALSSGIEAVPDSDVKQMIQAALRHFDETPPATSHGTNR